MSTAFDSVGNFNQHNRHPGYCSSMAGVIHVQIQIYQTICNGGHNSRGTLTEFVIPQGSELGTILFSIYTLSLGAIFRKHNLQYHIYANYTKLYPDFTGTQVGKVSDAVYRIEQCIEKARQFNHIFLLLSSQHRTGNTNNTSHVLTCAEPKLPITDDQ